MDALIVQAKSPQLIGILQRNFPNCSWSGIGKRIPISLKLSHLDLKAKFGGNVRKAIHGKRRFLIAHDIRQICAPVAATERYAKTTPWGQAFALLKGIAEFPREAMTNRFFWQGIRTDEDSLIKAMNVAGDHLVEEYGGRKAKQCAEVELDLLKRLEDAPGEALAKCKALWTLITTGNMDAVVALINLRPAS